MRGSPRPLAAGLLSVMMVVGVCSFGLILLAMVMAATRHARHHELGVVLLAHPGRLVHKRDGGPELLVAMVAPGRHASHLDCEPASNRDPVDFALTL